MSETFDGRHRDDDATPATQPVNQPVGEDAAEVVTHQERAVAGTETVESGRVKVRKHVESYPVEQVVPRSVEEVEESERVPAADNDSGQVETLPDGSVSIPVFEEVLVVTKKVVVKERVIIRKSTSIDEYTLRTELRREHVEVTGEGEVDIADNRPEDQR